MPLRTLLLLCLLVLPAAAAEPSKDPERPWAKGVPVAKQNAALELFRDGNNKLRDGFYKAARDQYLDALKAWDHPAIHYNLSLSLMNLDQPVEAHDHLMQALKYGAAPLDADKMEQAHRYQQLIEKQLSRVSIRCDLSSAVVRVDGQQIFVAPGQWEGMMRAGPHAIVATHEGYVPVERAEVLIGGESKQFDLQLFRTEDLTEYRRLWPVAMPWLVVGGGAAIAALGVGLHLTAKDTFVRYDAQITGCAQASAGACLPRPEVTSLRTQADTLQGFAVASYALGGAALVSGAVLVYLNRLQPFIRTVGPTVMLLPSLSPNQAQATLLVTF